MKTICEDYYLELKYDYEYGIIQGFLSILKQTPVKSQCPEKRVNKTDFCLKNKTETK